MLKHATNLIQKRYHTFEKMNDKDLILQQMISIPDRSPDSFFTPDSLNSVILKDKNIDEVEFLIRQIIKEKPELIKVEKTILCPLAINPTGLVESFLKNGGFEKIESDLKLKENIEPRKSKVDLELAEKMLEEYPKTKWFARIGLLIAVVLALKELYIWLMQSPSQ